MTSPFRLRSFAALMEVLPIQRGTFGCGKSCFRFANLVSR